MNALHQEIAALIEANGPMPVERYMQLCLQHPTHGYYTTREAIGAGGDFTTAPEISQMFGELIGLWAAETWAQSGAFQPARVVELGPGRGALIADLERASRIAPPFHSALAIDLVETSLRLRAEQRTALGDFAAVQWRDTLGAAPQAPAIYIANEFFDALPIRQYVRKDGAWRERMVGLNAAGGFQFGADVVAQEQIAAVGPEGAILEVGAAGVRVMTEMAARIVRFGGAALIIDYGYARTQAGETLQAMRAHEFSDPLQNPGEADLTAHVDFSALARAATAAGAAVHGPVTQGAFLRALGIETRAQRLKRNATAQQAADIDSALQRLTEASHARGMGVLFKVLCVTRRGAPTPPAFEEGAAA